METVGKESAKFVWPEGSAIWIFGCGVFRRQLHNCDSGAADDPLLFMLMSERTLMLLLCCRLGEWDIEAQGLLSEHKQENVARHTTTTCEFETFLA